jgi:radical SAM protein with 4Fe4S-binding SPASM domain
VNGALLQRISDTSKALHVPLEVLFEVTHRCNLPCVHCYLPNHADNGELSLAEVTSVLDQLAAAGTVFLTLTGGEVLSRSDFLEILDAAAARGFAVKVLTNATLIDDAVADRFAAAGVLEVSVSVYGADPAIHDAVTDMPGSFVRTMQGVERLRARGLHVILKTPMLTLNGEMAKDLHRYATLHEMPCNFDLTITPKNNGDPGPMALALHHKTMVDLMSAPPFDQIFLENDGSGPGPEPCNAGRGYCAIGPTGDLSPCIMMPVVVGNLRQRRFDELWRGDPFLGKLRALTFDDLATCRSCDVKGSCSRCPGIAMQRGQDVAGCDLSGKQVARARVEARKRLHVIH